jgi:ribosomal protein L11 methyltransferase
VLGTWLEVSLTVDGELAEAVAEVLARYAENGVVIESTAVTAAADDSQGQEVGPLRVSGFLPVDERLESKRRSVEEALWYLGRIRPLPPTQFRTIQEQDWSQAWKRHYQPIAIGRRLMIVPAWLETPDPGRTAIRIDPGMAFGTGTHPTTQLCMEALEALSASSPPVSVIDLGCGSGILAVAALKLGAGRALGLDIDPLAVKAAQENAALNEVADRFEIGLGSLAEARQGRYGLLQAPLVLANILAPVIIQLLDEGLADLLNPGGALVLSGILTDQAGEVEAALGRHGLAVEKRLYSGDWVALQARK